MAKASQLIQGRRLLRRVKLPLANAGHLLGPQSPELVAAQREAGISASDPAPDVGLRALTGFEWAHVLEKAAEFAVERGGKAEDDNELYELGKAVYMILAACRDPDDPEQGPFFDSADQILESIDLGRDGIAWLAESIATWQDATHPQKLQMTMAEFNEAVEKLAGGSDIDSIPFVLSLHPVLRVSLLRTMAQTLLVASAISKSSTGTESADTSESTKRESAQPSKPKRRSRKSQQQTGMFRE